jgi:hypothetical protein
VVTSVTRVSIAAPPAERTEATVMVASSSSPATTGAWWTKVCSPWTIREYSSPTPGSAIMASVAGWATTTAKVGGATTSSKPARRAASTSWCSGCSAPTAAANWRTASRPTT